MKKIRILFLASADAGNVNAQSLNAREIASRLDATRFEISLFYSDQSDPRLRNRDNIRLLPLPRRFQTLSILKEMLIGPEIIAYLDCSPASYLYVHLPRALRRRTRTVLHLEGPANFEGTDPLFRHLYHGVVRRCDAWTAITGWIAQYYQGSLKRKPSGVLPVGVDCGFFAPPGKDVRKGSTVLFVGSLLLRKGALDVVQAASHFPEVKFRMIGAGRNGFEQIVAGKIAELGVGNVFLEGTKPQAQIAQAMHESDVLLLPSRSEGLPKVTLEAAAAGLPCIVFRDYETPSVVDGVTGFQVANRQEMIEKLSLLLHDPQLRIRMGAAAQQHAQQFDWNQISGSWEQAYLAISASAGR